MDHTTLLPSGVKVVGFPAECSTSLVLVLCTRSRVFKFWTLGFLTLSCLGVSFYKGNEILCAFCVLRRLRAHSRGVAKLREIWSSSKLVSHYFCKCILVELFEVHQEFCWFGFMIEEGKFKMKCLRMINIMWMIIPLYPLHCFVVPKAFWSLVLKISVIYACSCSYGRTYF